MLSRKVTIAAKIESVYGTDSVPTDSDLFLIEAPKLTVNGEQVKREVLSASLSAMGHIIGIKDYELEFITELKGYGTSTAPKVGCLLKSCSMTQAYNSTTSTYTYTPSSAADPSSVTIYVNYDGILFKMLGCRGSAKFNYEAGKYGKITWKFRGLYATPIDSAISSSQPTENVPPVCKASLLSIASYSPAAKTFEVDLNNTLAPNISLNASQNVESIRITERKPNGSYDPDAVLEATESYWADWEAASKQAFTITNGTAAGNKVVLSGYMQSTKIDHDNADGILKYKIPFECPRNADSGDDELQIVYYV